MTRLIHTALLGVVLLSIASSFAVAALKDSDPQKAAIKVRTFFHFAWLTSFAHFGRYIL